MPQIDIRINSSANNSGFESARKSSEGLEKSLGQLTKKLTNTFEGRDLGRSLATAFGINADKIAEQLARWYTGVSELEEKAYAAIEALSDRATELAVKNMRSRLSNEQLLTMAIRERDKIQNQIDNSHATTGVQQEELLKKRIKLEETIAQILDLQKKKGDEVTAVEQELQALALRRATVENDPNIHGGLVLSNKIAQMGNELRLTEKLLALEKARPAKDGETKGDKDLKVIKLEERIKQLQNEIKFSVNSNQFDERATGSKDKFKEFNLDRRSSKQKAGDGVRMGAQDWVTSLGSQAEQVANAISDSIGTAVQGISDGIMGWIDGTKSFAQAMQGIASSVLKTMLHTIVQMGAQWLVNQILIKTGIVSINAVQDAHRISNVAKENAATAATLPLKTASAAASGISSFGLALVFGALAVGLILALAGGFADGGFTAQGGRNKPAGIVHAGEWVAPQWMVNHPGFGQVIAGLEGARQGAPGFDMGGLTSPASNITRPAYSAPSGSGSANHHIYLDRAEWARAMQEDSEGFFHEIAAREIRRHS